MGEIFWELLHKPADFIGQEAQSPWGFIYLLLIGVNIFLLSNSENRFGKLELAAYAMIVFGGIGLFIDASNLPISYKQQAQKPRILETGYSLLNDIGGEESGYGLYSYALIVKYNSRSAKFLSDVFSAIPTVEDTASQRSQTNIFYIPMRMDKVNEFPEAGIEYGESFDSNAKDSYDFKLARSLLNHLCNPPAEEIRTVCEGDLSRGPYIFSYAQPASKLAPVPPPFLFMDLSDVHERAFPEIIAAFRAQVKRDDISDRAKIDTLRLGSGPIN